MLLRRGSDVGARQSAAAVMGARYDRQQTLSRHSWGASAEVGEEEGQDADNTQESSRAADQGQPGPLGTGPEGKQHGKQSTDHDKDQPKPLPFTEGARFLPGQGPKPGFGTVSGWRGICLGARVVSGS